MGVQHKHNPINHSKHQTNHPSHQTKTHLLPPRQTMRLTAVPGRRHGRGRGRVRGGRRGGRSYRRSHRRRRRAVGGRGCRAHAGGRGCGGRQGGGGGRRRGLKAPPGLLLLGLCGCGVDGGSAGRWVGEGVRLDPLDRSVDRCARHHPPTRYSPHPKQQSSQPNHHPLTSAGYAGAIKASIRTTRMSHRRCAARWGLLLLSCVAAMAACSGAGVDVDSVVR